MAALCRLATLTEVATVIPQGRYQVFYETPGPGSLSAIRPPSADEVAAKCLWDLNRTADARGVHFVAEVDGAVVGAIRGLPFQSDADKQFWKFGELSVIPGIAIPDRNSQIAEVGRLYVLPTHLRRGIARQLYLALEGHLKRTGFSLAVGAISQDNSPSAGLFQSVGYQVYAVDKNDSGRPDFLFHYKSLA